MVDMFYMYVLQVLHARGHLKYNDFVRSFCNLSKGLERTLNILIFNVTGV